MQPRELTIRGLVLGVSDAFAPAKILGFVGFVVLVVWLYRWMLAKSREAAVWRG